MATLQDITDKIREAVGADAGLGKSLKFNLKGEGFIHIDGGSVTNEDAPADLTLTTTLADLQQIASGSLDATTAVMSGRLQLSDMMAAMALQPKMIALFQRIR